MHLQAAILSDQAIADGAATYRAGERLDCNPHVGDKVLGLEWRSGWLTAESR